MLIVVGLYFDCCCLPVFSFFKVVVAFVCVCLDVVGCGCWLG